MDDVLFLFGGWRPVARIVVVGSLAYGALVLLLRVGKKRTLARLTAFDFVITVALGASFGRVLTAKGVPLSEAVTAFALLVVLQLLVAWLQLRSPRFAHLVTASPTLLYFRGRYLREAMRRERVTEQEMLAIARRQGAGSLDGVEAVVLEADGRFALIRAERADDGSTLHGLDGATRP